MTNPSTGTSGSATDVVVSRAGMSTVSELAAAGKPQLKKP